MHWIDVHWIDVLDWIDVLGWIDVQICNDVQNRADVHIRSESHIELSCTFRSIQVEVIKNKIISENDGAQATKIIAAEYPLPLATLQTRTQTWLTAALPPSEISVSSLIK